MAQGLAWCVGRKRTRNRPRAGARGAAHCMKVAVFALRIDAEAGGFDDAELRAFVEAHDVLGVHEHMLHRDGEPVTVVVGPPATTKVLRGLERAARAPPPALGVAPGA